MQQCILKELDYLIPLACLLIEHRHFPENFLQKTNLIPLYFHDTRTLPILQFRRKVMQNYIGYLNCFDFCKVANLFLGASPAVPFTFFLSKQVKIGQKPFVAPFCAFSIWSVSPKSYIIAHRFVTNRKEQLPTR